MTTGGAGDGTDVAAPSSGGLATTVAALAGCVDALLAVPLWQAGDAGVREAVVELERQAARLEAARLHVLAAADERRVGSASGAQSTADWLVAATTTRAEHARRRVDLAVALDHELVATGAALAQGRVTGDQAGVVHTVMTRLPVSVDAETRADAEVFLLEQAAHLDPRRLAQVGRRLVARLDVGADDDLARTEAAQERRRQLRCTQADDGTWMLSGLLDPVAGTTLMAALEPLAAPRPATDGTPDTRPHPRRLADALVQVAEAHLAGDVGSASSRPRLVVTVPLATLRDPAEAGADPATLPGGHPLSGEQTALLACDAQLVPVLVDDDRPLDVGRSMYSWPDRVRTAVRLRDRTCTWDGCSRPAEWGHIHHLLPWSQGGTTSERNAACLCGHHHRVVHREGWRGELVGAQVVWHPPDGIHPYDHRPRGRDRSTASSRDGVRVRHGCSRRRDVTSSARRRTPSARAAPGCWAFGGGHSVVGASSSAAGDGWPAAPAGRTAAPFPAERGRRRGGSG